MRYVNAIALGLVLGLALSCQADPVDVRGIGIPTIDNPDPLRISNGEWDWAGSLDSFEHKTEYNFRPYEGVFRLTSTSIVDDMVQLNYRDEENDFLFQMTSFTGETSLDPDDFVEPTFGGFELWTFVKVGEFNEFNSITSATAIPVAEPVAGLLLLIGVGTCLVARRQGYSY